jgi:hypothetical protein
VINYDKPPPGYRKKHEKEVVVIFQNEMMKNLHEPTGYAWFFTSGKYLVTQRDISHE